VTSSKQIRVGDVVRLTGGGPEMVVLRLDEWGADCLWSVGACEQTVWVASECMVRPVERQPQWATSLRRNAAVSTGLRMASRG
jgi:uncharacterized protein YodC (DUF2158 family)